MKKTKQFTVISLCISICFSLTACEKSESTAIADSIKSNAEATLDSYDIDTESFSDSFKEIQGSATDAIGNFYTEAKSPENIEAMQNLMSEAPEKFKEEYNNLIDTYDIDVDGFSESFKEIQGEATDAIGNFYTEAKSPENIEAMQNFMLEAKDNVTEFYDTTVPDEYKIEQADLVDAYENLIINAEPLIEVLQNEISNIDKDEALAKFNDVVQGYSQVYGKILESNTSLFEPIEEGE